jgi:DNA-binding SARP family transcriptional activator
VEDLLQFRMLGPLTVTWGGEPVDLGPRKQRTVLAALLVDANRVVGVDRLTDILWGDAPPATATGALHVYASRLRRALEPDRPRGGPSTVLVTEPPGYVLRVAEDQLDANAFDLLAAEGQRLLADGDLDGAKRALAEALALWRGPVLADFAFESFVYAEAARLDELRAAAIEERVSADLRLGHHNALIGELESLVAERPLRERLWAQLMLALYRADRQGEALRAFHRARTVLCDELGIEPGPLLRRIHEDVLSQSSRLDWRPAAELPRWRTGGAARHTGRRFEPRPPPLPGGLVGRNYELRILRRAYDALQKGKGGLVLVSGEPGIGKTRLVEELAGWVTGGGHCVAWGRCEEGDGAPSFWPWVQVIRSLLKATDDEVLRNTVGPTAGEVAQIAPEIKEYAPAVEPPEALDPAAARFNLYEAVFDLLARLSAGKPFAVVLEDLQWADVPSLELLERAANRVDDTSVLLICTFRDVDPPISGQLAAILGSLARLPKLQRLPLTGLSVDEVALFMELTAPDKPSDELAAAVHARTDGNPFFVAELAKLLGEEQRGAEEVPTGVRDVIRRRLTRLPEGTQGLLEVASVLGREVDLRLVAEAGESRSQDITELVDASVAVGILVESPDVMGMYRFAHTLVREAIYEQLGGARRARLHARAAEALERLHGLDDDHAAELASHVIRATPVLGPVPALRQLLRSAEVAERRLAHEEAEAQLQRALELVATLPPGNERSYLELTVQHRVAALLSVTKGCHTAPVAEAWGRAHALSRELGSAPEVLSAMWGLARLSRNRAQYDVSTELADQLLDMAGTYGSEFAVAGHESRGLSAFFTGDPVAAACHLSEAATLSDTTTFTATAVTSVLHPVVSTRAYLACVRALLGDGGGSDELIAEAVRMADVSDRPLNQAISRLCAAQLATIRADAAGVRRWAEEVSAMAKARLLGPLGPVSDAFRAWGLAHAGDPDAAEPMFAQTMISLQASGWRLGWTCFCFLRADAHRLGGRLDKALRAVEQALASGQTTGEHYFDAELYRLRGEITAARWPDRRAEAESSLRRAVAIADAQSAVLLRERAEASLALLV